MSASAERSLAVVPEGLQQAALSGAEPPEEASVMQPAIAVAAAKPQSRNGVRRILTVLTQLGLMQIVVAFGGLIRNKFMAIYLKPAGFGEFTQLTGIAASVWVCVQFGMAVALSRNAAAAQEGEGRQRQLSTANMLTVGLALVSLVLLVPLLFSPMSGPVLKALGVSAGLEQKLLLLMLLAVGPIEVLRNNYTSFLTGIVDIKGLSTKRSLAILASTAVAVPLIAVFHMAGAAVQAFVASFFVALLLGSRCRSLGYHPLGFTFDRRTAATLMVFGGASLMSGFSNNATDTLIRAHLIATAGVAANGLYQAAYSICTLVTAVVLGSVGAYSLATLSETKDTEIVSSRIEELLRVVLPVAALGLGCLGLLAHPMLLMLFSPAFVQAERFLPLLLCANYFQVAVWVTGAPLLGFGLVRAWLIIQLGGVGLRYVATILSTPYLGVNAIPAGVLIEMVFHLAAYIVICSRYIKLRLSPKMLIPFLAGAAAILSATFGGFFVRHLLAYFGALCLLACTIGAMAWPEVKTAWRNFDWRTAR